MLFKKRIERSFVSDLDQFLFQFDYDHPEKSPAQQAEIGKARRITQKRDNSTYTIETKDFWESF